MQPDRTQDAPVEPAESDPVSDQPAPVSLRWNLQVEPTTMTMAQRGQCRVRIEVVNEGTSAVEPQLHLGKFTLNGEPSMTFSFAFENGAMESRWSSLPPGQRASTERALCATLLDKPGMYTLGFQHGESNLTIDVRVTP
jgi:hypothetical protein